MAGGTKRLDLQFGSFACSVQGFDDPVEPVKQVLRAMQTMLEDSPELATAGITFEADTIEQLVEEVSRRAGLADADVEIVPGLVIIHHGGLKRGAATSDLAAEEETGYVNIFAPAGGGEVEDFEGLAPPIDYPDEPAADDAPDHEAVHEEHADLLADRLGRVAGGRDIFAEGTGAGDGSVFADPMADTGHAAGGADVEHKEVPAAHGSFNFFSTPLTSFEDRPREDEEEQSDGPSEPLRLFTSSRPSQPEPEPLALTAAHELAPVEEAPGFTAAGLAASAEVTSVPDLMATAAAWMVLIKGQTTFSRKEVLKVFDTIPGEHENSLESRIKGFGKAVRNGQLIMVEDGVFGLSRKELERFQRAL